MEAIDFKYELIFMIDELVEEVVMFRTNVVVGAKAYNVVKFVEA